MTRQLRPRPRGVSLIEALVALAVMAFGMLGVVGMQTALRGNADLSRQRAEAVRLAQEEVERLRNFSVLVSADLAPGQLLAFDEIASAPAAPASSEDANTTFFRETIVGTPTAADPLVRHMRVRVTWTDRRAELQTVELSTMIAGVPPELAALPSMRTDRSALRQPEGRNAAIPRGAENLGDGTSVFVPPGGPSDRSWIFNNATGLITQICQPAGTCTATNRWLLAGTVGFATGASSPTSAEAENPVDPVVSLTMVVNRSTAGYSPSGADEPCVTSVAGADRLRYFCAMPTTLLDVPGQRVWSGQVRFSGIALSAALSDATATNYKICRYTPDERQFTAAAQVVAAGESFERYNSRHPNSFLRVNGPQLNKNFLVISAGDGTAAHSCPDEDTGSLIESNTWPHVPVS